ncbi:MAG: hypothetical protein H7308_08895 [Chthonomonadaceae bacterium]|nr:hypothetical protein [Chthonomonadaceae bacterium]
MEIKLLGTGGADGMPGLFCRCSACLYARLHGGKDLRTRASALIDSTLKIDLPPDTLSQSLKGELDMSAVETLLFTHGHDDHFCLSEIQYLGKHFISPPDHPLYLLAPLNIIEQVDLLYANRDLPLCFQVLSLWKTILAGGYRITPLEAKHVTDMECFNYLIQEISTGKTLLYATDTGWWDEKTWSFLVGKHVDGVVMECGMGPIREGYAGHLSIAQIIAAREKLLTQNTITPDTLFVATHLSHAGGFLHQDYEAVLCPHGITTGFDGMTFTL